MPNLLFLNDHGNIIFDYSTNKVYAKVGPRNDIQPNAAWEANDVPSIVGYTYTTYPDPQGRLIYTAEEMAVAENIYFAKLEYQPPNWYTIWASAPVSGVLRYGECYGVGGTLRVNGVTYSISYVGGSTDIRHTGMHAINIAAGSLVEVYSNSTDGRYALGIIPFVYP